MIIDIKSKIINITLIFTFFSAQTDIYIYIMNFRKINVNIVKFIVTEIII